MKGIDAYIATIILILIAIGLAVALINWQSWFLPHFSQSVSGQNQLNCLRSGMVLQNISYNCNGDCSSGVNHTLITRIINTGDTPLTLSKVLLQTSTGIFDYPLSSTLNPDQAFDATNVSTTSCANLNHSVSRVIIQTSCPNVPGPFDGSAMVWLNC